MSGTSAAPKKCSQTERLLNQMPYAKGAMFDASGADYVICHPATRVDLLSQIQDWARHPQSKSIFWLSGMAGTGKSTISWTFAKWLDDQSPRGVVDLGASFFFKRGEGDRESASRFFSTITRQLILKIPGLDVLVAEAIASSHLIFEKALGEQFDKLIYQPLQKISPRNCSTFVVVVDALDECEKERDIKTILDLWSRLTQIMTVRVRLFLTSRPDLPIQLGFEDMSVDTFQDMVLQNAVPPTTIKHDIYVFLRDEFSKIRDGYKGRPSSTALEHDWPGAEKIQVLTDAAIPLFIVAATICRFVRDPIWDNPRNRLEKILDFGGVGTLSQMEQTYIAVLEQMSAMSSELSDVELLHQQFRMVVGSIVVLAEPLSISSLEGLLTVDQDIIWNRLHPLHSVLRVPNDLVTPVQTLHFSFREFLLSDKIQDKPFGVDGPATHRLLLTKCLQLLSKALRENVCDLQYPGQPRQEVERSIINERLTPVLQYACRYWVYHAQDSKVPIKDDNEVHEFLRKHFLQWLEALSLMDRAPEVLKHVGVLRSLVLVNESKQLSAFLEDARRIVLTNRCIIDLAPLQIYSSAIVFAPQTSVVRNVCGRIPTWIQRCPITPGEWSAELQKLEGHIDWVNAVAFSPDGSLLASGSRDESVRLWDTATGQELQKFHGHTDCVNAVAFSPDSSLLASGSNDKTVRLWDTATGQELQKLEGHTDWVNAVAFSSDRSVLASGSGDKTVRLWNLSTGQELQMLEGHTDWVNAVAFSPDSSVLASGSRDKTVRLCGTATGQELQKLEGHTGSVSAVAFSPDSSLLASGSGDKTVRLWNLSTGQELQLEGHTRSVSAVVFSPDGSLLASGSDDMTVRLWDTATGQELQLEGHTRSVSAVVFSPDGSLLASGSDDKTVRLWDTATGQELQKLHGHTDCVNVVAFSPDGSLLASGSDDKTVRLWNLSTGQELQKLQRRIDWFKAVAFSPDGSLLASGLDDKTIMLWNPSTGQELQKFHGHTDCVNAVAFSPDSSLLASGSDDMTVRLWDTATGQELQKLEGHTDWVNAVAFSPDSSLLALGSRDESVRLWDTATGQELQKLEGHTDWVNAVAFSPDSSVLASGSRDKTVRLWDTTTGALQQTLKINVAVHELCFSSDGKSLKTDRGQLDISSRSGAGIYVDEAWVVQGMQRILWLPLAYRARCVAVHSHLLVMGHASGHISMLEIDHGQTAYS